MIKSFAVAIAATAGLVMPLTTGANPASANPAGSDPAGSDPAGLVTVDVIDGWHTDAGTRMAGLRIRVSAGWKTYWRSPGDAGIPPRFDWSRSQNLAATAIHWPKPEVFDTYGQRTLGYAGEIVLPVELTPLDPSQPIIVAGDAELGICSDICVAVEQSYGESSTDGTTAIHASLGAQPARAGIDVARCALEPISDGLRLTATLHVPHQGGEELAVVEVAPDDIWVSEPISTRKGNALTTVVDLVPPDAAPFDLDRSALRITVLGADGATETTGCPAF